VKLSDFNYKMSEEEREAQRISFAYGNTKLSNQDITREDVIKASQELKDDLPRTPR